MSRHWLRAILLTIGIVVFLFALEATAQDEIASGMGAQPAAPKVAVLPEVKQRLLALVPSPAPAQAVVQDATAYYVAETLYQYMDGGADVYVLYDFQTLLHQEFKVKEADITVDIFDMGTPDNAFGMYSSERSPSYDYISMGAEGYRNQGILNFLKGRYYVKLAGFGSGADAVLDQFARSIAARIDGIAEFPALLQKLPQVNRKPRSEQYVLKDPLGHAFLGPAYLVSYDGGDRESTLMVSVAPSGAEAQKRLALLADHFRKTGKCVDAPDLGAGAIRANNSFEGDVLAGAKGSYVVALFMKNTGSEPIFKEALSKIE